MTIGPAISQMTSGPAVRILNDLSVNDTLYIVNSHTRLYTSFAYAHSYMSEVFLYSVDNNTI